jgi:hypothetical protein
MPSFKEEINLKKVYNTRGTKIRLIVVGCCPNKKLLNDLNENNVPKEAIIATA